MRRQRCRPGCRQQDIQQVVQTLLHQLNDDDGVKILNIQSVAQVNSRSSSSSDLMSCFPLELQSIFLSYLTAKDLIQSMLVCSCWYHMAIQDVLWEPLLFSTQEHYPLRTLLGLPSSTSAREVYQLYFKTHLSDGPLALSPSCLRCQRPFRDHDILSLVTTTGVHIGRISSITPDHQCPCYSVPSTNDWGRAHVAFLTPILWRSIASQLLEAVISITQAKLNCLLRLENIRIFCPVSCEVCHPKQEHASDTPHVPIPLVQVLLEFCYQPRDISVQYTLQSIGLCLLKLISRNLANATSWLELLPADLQAAVRLMIEADNTITFA